jgi:hypothetical protein
MSAREEQARRARRIAAAIGDAAELAQLDADRARRWPKRPLNHKVRRDRLMRVFDALREACDSGDTSIEWRTRSAFNEMHWAEKYDPHSGGGGEHGVIIAHWTYPWLERWERLMGRLPAGERVECDSLDSVDTCDSCNLAVILEGSDDFVVLDGRGVVCRTCAESDVDDVLESARRSRDVDRLPEWFREAWVAEFERRFAQETEGLTMSVGAYPKEPCSRCSGTGDYGTGEDGGEDPTCDECSGSGLTCECDECADAGEDGDGNPIDEASFSWRHCETCCSSLGGDRHVAHGIDDKRNLYHLSICTDCLFYVANGETPRLES